MEKIKIEKGKTPVIFLKHKMTKELFAFFPLEKEPFNGYRHDLYTCYAHIGQHGTCALEYVKESRILKRKSMYSNLETELRNHSGDGYNLEVLNEVIEREDIKRMIKDADFSNIEQLN